MFIFLQSFFFLCSLFALSSCLFIISSFLLNLLLNASSEFFISVSLFFNSRVSICFLFIVSVPLLKFPICWFSVSILIVSLNYFIILIIAALRFSLLNATSWPIQRLFALVALFPEHGSHFPIFYRSSNFWLIIEHFRKYFAMTQFCFIFQVVLFLVTCLHVYYGLSLFHNVESLMCLCNLLFYF